MRKVSDIMKGKMMYVSAPSHGKKSNLLWRETRVRRARLFHLDTHLANRFAFSPCTEIAVLPRDRVGLKGGKADGGDASRCT